MKVALVLSVAAQVAAQPFPFLYPPQPESPCGLIGYNMECCIPQQFNNQGAWGGCAAPPSFFFNTPIPPWLIRPPMPPPDFLQQVCCPEGRDCCIRDRNNPNPSYACCAAGQVCNVYGSAGKCEAGIAGNGSAPVGGAHLDTYGRCPDSTLPLTIAPGEAYRCSLNPMVTSGACPVGSECVRDLQHNQNTGVCCSTNHTCAKYGTCEDCMKAPVPEDIVFPGQPPRQPCAWLSQGDLDNQKPRCVQSCDNFPGKSCIMRFGSEAESLRRCPYSNNATYGSVNGTWYNTGTCNRRCGLTGTGRSSRINNQANFPVTNTTLAADAIQCCKDYNGDYCCDTYGRLAAHCQLGRVPQGPLCGVPVRGTPNNFFNEPPPMYGPPPMGPYYGPGPMMGPPPAFFGAPMYAPSMYGMGAMQGYGGFAPALGGGFGMGFGGMGFGGMGFGGMGGFGMGGMYGGFFRDGGFDGDSDVAAPDLKQMWALPPPNFGPYPPPPPGPPAPEPPAPVDQQPSEFVCSCDSNCKTQFNDCCNDYEQFCIIPTVTAP